MSEAEYYDHTDLTQSAKNFLEKTVEALMDAFQISPAEMAVILDDIQSNINPYVSAEELKEQGEDAPTEEMDRPITKEELKD